MDSCRNDDYTKINDNGHSNYQHQSKDDCWYNYDKSNVQNCNRGKNESVNKSNCNYDDENDKQKDDCDENNDQQNDKQYND
jgi:hypothetical protein